MASEAYPRVYRLALCATLLLLVPSTFIGQESPNKTSGSIAAFMQELHDRGQFNGVVLVAQHDGVIYRGSFGIANRSSGRMYKEDTPSCLASVSKPFTALAIMMLAERGHLHYEDHLSLYVSGLHEELGAVSIRQLLTHTSGIPDYSDLNVEHPGMTNEDVLSALRQVEHLQFPAGQKYQYSNSGYVLLGLVVEKISGESLPAYLNEHVFKPLNMKSSFVLTDAGQKTDAVARAYSPFGGLDDYNAYVTGDGGMYASVNDLFKFDRALYTKTLISQQTLTEAFTPGRVREGTTNYGFGWNIADAPPGKRVWHTGSTADFRAFLERRLYDHSVVIMLTNEGNSKRTEINEAIHHILAGQPYTFPKRSMAVKMRDVLLASGIDSALAAYQSEKSQKVSEYDVNEGELNTLGYQLLYGDKRQQDALRIFLLNTTEHPSSSNAFDSLAECYEVLGDRAHAKKNYEKALELDSTNIHARAMLGRM